MSGPTRHARRPIPARACRAPPVRRSLGEGRGGRMNMAAPPGWTRRPGQFTLPSVAGQIDGRPAMFRFRQGKATTSTSRSTTVDVGRREPFDERAQRVGSRQSRDLVPKLESSRDGPVEVVERSGEPRVAGRGRRTFKTCRFARSSGRPRRTRRLSPGWHAAGIRPPARRRAPQAGRRRHDEAAFLRGLFM